MYFGHEWKQVVFKLLFSRLNKGLCTTNVFSLVGEKIVTFLWLLLDVCKKSKKEVTRKVFFYFVYSFIYFTVL